MHESFRDLMTLLSTFLQDPTGHYHPQEQKGPQDLPLDHPGDDQVESPYLHQGAPLLDPQQAGDILTKFLAGHRLFRQFRHLKQLKTLRGESLLCSPRDRRVNLQDKTWMTDFQNLFLRAH